ncbi:MAG: MarR family transcriptional regulator [Planctomycetota bacterium]
MGLTSTESVAVEPTKDNSYQLMLLLRTAYFSLRRKCNSVCQDSNCNGDQFVILSTLYGQSQRVTQQFLSDETGYDPVTTGTMLKTMQRHGLIDREPHPEDGRAKLVKITTAGKRTFRKLWRDSDPLRKAFIKSMSQNRQKNAVKILNDITRAMNSLEV